MSFRDTKHKPTRRPISRAVSHYRDHKLDLAIDFKNRCGYCNSLNTYRTASFEIDHFIPRIRNKKPFLTIVSETEYSNLVYSCKSCNNAKSNKWPSGNELIHNINNEGFIDPCDSSYDAQFRREADGKITGITILGQWMHKELKLFKTQHEIIYKIEELDTLIEEMNKLLDVFEGSESLELAIYRRFRKLVIDYKSYICQLSAV